MAKHLTDKQERFAVAVASGKSLADAYRDAYQSKAGGANLRKEASALAKKLSIKARIAALKGHAAKKVKAAVKKKVAEAVEAALPPNPTDREVMTAVAIAAVEVDNVWIEATLVRAVAKGIADERVCDRKGVPTGEVRTVNLPAAVRALELLGKERGMFVDTKRVIHDPLSEFTHQQLKQMLAEFDDVDAAERDPKVVRGPGRTGTRRTTH